MDKKNQIGLLLTAFIGILIGISLLIPTSDIINQQSVTGASTNESFTVVEDSWSNLLQDDLIAVSAVRNGSGIAIGSGNYTGTHVDLVNGRLNISGATGDGTYYADYTYYPSAYIKDSTTRSLSSVIIIFFILSIVVVGIIYVYKSGLFNIGK